MKIIFLALIALCDGRANIQIPDPKTFEETNNWLNNILANVSLENSFKHGTLNPTAAKDSCQLKESGVGKCVKPSQCDEEKEEIDLSQAGVYRQSACHYLLKCCPVDQVRKTPKPPVVIASNPSCGWSNPGASVFRKKDLHHADFGEFPWMIAMLNPIDGDKWNYFGGGSLIHPSVVITAAHKVYKMAANKIKCRAGEWDTQTENELFAHVERDVKKIVVHPDFNEKRSSNNVALLILQSPFNLTDQPHMGLACLGRQTPNPGTLCYSMGWGKNFFDSQEYATVLKKVPLPIVERNSCEYSLRTTLLGSKFRLNNVDVSRYAVYGLVAFGVGCGDKTPGVYASVPYVYDWVVEALAMEGIAAATFTV
ncbi:phenoloxidase-activating factor 2-like [Zerene cesonia]|uniref:phenoloxidase-activating factor 2-like n=1 Tax=Zerene cesonia TaxID=33412 RepID=UPI0018E56393|nr:phenoloxidase-activating factor 2-like [Zerene cesonia]